MSQFTKFLNILSRYHVYLVAAVLLLLVTSVFFINKTESPLAFELDFIEYSSDESLVGSVIPASCESNNPHVAGECTPRVNGSCHPAHYRCNAGSAYNQSSNSSRYTWSCAGSGGGVDQSCTENKINGSCGASRNSCVSGNLSGPAQSATQYTWSCVSPNGGSNASCSAWIPPVVSISASPNPIGHSANNGPANTTIAWSVTNASSCNASGGWSGAKNSSSGSQVMTQSISTNYVLTCSGNGGQVSNSVVAIMPSGDISASDCEIAPENQACDSTVMWHAYNFIGSPAITRPPSGTLSNAAVGPGYFPMNPDTFVFRLDDTNSGFSRTATPSVQCNPLSVWQVGQCRTLPVVTVIANPNIVRSGTNAPVSVTVQSVYDLTCIFRDGGAPQSFTHTGPGTATYTYNTRPLTSAQIVTVECTSPTYNLVTDTNEARVNVVPTVQEI